MNIIREIHTSHVTSARSIPNTSRQRDRFAFRAKRKAAPTFLDGDGGGGDRPRRTPRGCAIAELQGAGYLRHDVCHGIFPREFHERRNDMRDVPCRFAISRHRYEHRHSPR